MSAESAQRLNALKRQAIEIVAQLPDHPIEAIRVLSLAREFVEKFLTKEAAEIPLRLVS